MTTLLLHVFLGLLLMLIPAGALYLLDRVLLRTLSVAVVRMGLQLAALCLVVWLLYRVDSPWLCLAWLVGASVVSACFVLRKLKLPLGRQLLPVGGGLLLGTLLAGGWLLFVALPAERGTEPRWFVPVTALLLGHCMATMVRGLSAYRSALKTDEQQYEFLRGNGTPHLQAVVPFVRRAVQAVLAPAAANLSAMALTAMPLLLCGLLVGGFGPAEGLMVMLLLTVGCVAASVLSLLIAVCLADRQLFDKFGKLRVGKELAAGLLLAVVLTGCKGNKAGVVGKGAGVADSVVSGFYGTRAEPAGEASQAAADKERKTATVMYELPAPLTDRPEKIIRRKGYTVSYNQKTKTANWVAWHLTKAHTYGNNQRSQQQFTEDADVQAPRATDQDYYNSRYDRGHMCPAADNKWDPQAMAESFLFTNICPQNHGLNKYEWNDLEMRCRDWARQYGAVDIVCGPVFSSTGGQKTIGRNKVWVPDAFFKVVLCRQGKGKAIAFVYRNEGKKQTQAEALRTVDEVELLTGIDFFPALDNDVEARVEAESDLKAW